MLSKILRLMLLYLFVLPVSAKTIVVLGDSLSAAYGLKTSEGWVALLQKELGAAHKVINAGVSGDTSAGGLTRLPALLKQHKPQIVILELGANDGLRGLPLSTMQNNLSRIIEQSEKNGAKVVLVGVNLPPNYGKKYTQSFAQVYQMIAKQYSVAFVPSLLAGFEGDKASFQPDGIHPLANAQRKILQNVKLGLMPILHEDEGKKR